LIVAPRPLPAAPLRTRSWYPGPCSRRRVCASQALYRGAQAVARGAAQVLGGCTQAAARGAARCATSNLV
jgi:nitrous oxide reductase